MSVEPIDMRGRDPASAAQMLDRAADAAPVVAAPPRLAARDLFVRDALFADDRMRAALAASMRRAVEAIDAGVRGEAAALLAAQGDTGAVSALRDGDGTALFDRLLACGALDDGPLVRELAMRAAEVLLAERLPAPIDEDPDRPALLARLAQSHEPAVASAARALAIAEARRRGDGLALAVEIDLPDAVVTRLAWHVAAALRAMTMPHGAGVDAALATATVRTLAARDGDARMEAAAMGLARAIDASPEERAILLLDALGDQRLSLFCALIAYAAELELADVRALIVAPDDDRLWVVLRAIGLDRAALARIGYALCEADPRRRIEDFADRIDTIAAIDMHGADAALAPLRLPAVFRDAIADVERRAR